MGLYDIDSEYDMATWYENQGAYDTWVGADLQLDLMRRILLSDGYIFQGVAFPKRVDVNVPIGNTFSGALNLIPYSYVVSVTGFTANGNQFTMRLYDKGAQTDVYQRQFAWFPTVISNMSPSFNTGVLIRANDRNKPFGTHFFRDPLIVLPPGVLQIQLTNVGMPTFPGAPPGTVPRDTVQLFFNVAVPKNTVALQSRKVLTQADPTGTETMQGAAGLIAAATRLGS